jgi:modulator of FtsH protease
MPVSCLSPSTARAAKSRRHARSVAAIRDHEKSNDSSAWHRLSSIIQRDLSAMGKWLFIGAVMLLAAGITNFFIQSRALMITLSVIAIGIFPAFILHDLKRVQDGLETNYVSATLSVYLSIDNVFQSLLILLGIFGGRDK